MPMIMPAIGSTVVYISCSCARYPATVTGISTLVTNSVYPAINLEFIAIDKRKINVDNVLPLDGSKTAHDTWYPQ